MWFDRQAIQLRFNIIPKHIKKLPFDCSIKQISSPDQIFEQFLNFSNRSHGLLIADIIELNNSIETEEEDISYILDVHMQYF